MPGGGARVQNLGHLEMCCLHSVFSSLSPYLNKILIGMYSYLDHRYTLWLNFTLWHQTPGVGLEVKI